MSLPLVNYVDEEGEDVGELQWSITLNFISSVYFSIVLGETKHRPSCEKARAQNFRQPPLIGRRLPITEVVRIVLEKLESSGMPCKGEECIDSTVTSTNHPNMSPEDGVAFGGENHPEEPLSGENVSNGEALKPSEENAEVEPGPMNGVDAESCPIEPAVFGPELPPNGLPELEQLSIVDRRPVVSAADAPFEPLSAIAGEEICNDAYVDANHCRVFVTDYRIVIVTHSRQGVCSIPIGCVDLYENVDETFKIMCKDGRAFTIRCSSKDAATAAFKDVATAAAGTRPATDYFAYKFAAACARQRPLYLRRPSTIAPDVLSLQALEREFEKCQFPNSQWRITRVNEEFKICASYPKYLIVPQNYSDEELIEQKRGRFFERFPSAVWRCRRTGAVLLRSAQPEVSFFSSSQGDIKLFNAIAEVTNSTPKKKLVVVDARSYTAAWANRAKGGGFETGESYSAGEIFFMSLPNIHSIRYAFTCLRNLLHISSDMSTFFQQLHNTHWFQYMYTMFDSVERVVKFMLTDGQSVLVHCSDGWDRTAQIVSLVKVISDPFYRTIDGFEQLVMREWVEYGHKFMDRNSMPCTETNEKAPVFLQFLDCVHQLWLRNPDAFEFNQRYLMKLGQHQFSGLFGTFLFNTHAEFLKNGYAARAPGVDVAESIRLVSVFDYLHKNNHTFVNPAYDGRRQTRLISPKGAWELQLWKEVYCCTDVETIVNDPTNAISAAHQQSVLTEPPAVAPPVVEAAPQPPSRSHSTASINSTAGMDAPGSSGAQNIIPHSVVVNNATGSLGVSSSFSFISFSRRSDHGLSWKAHVDVDGLSRVPIEYEDRIVELHRHAMNAVAVATANNSAGSSNGQLEHSPHHSERHYSESSASRDWKPSPANEGTSLRRRGESNDSSSMIFNLDEDSSGGIGVSRRKRDSTCSFDLVASSAEQRLSMPTVLDEMRCEQWYASVFRCSICSHADILDENSEPRVGIRIPMPAATIPTIHKVAENRCCRNCQSALQRSGGSVPVR